MYVGLSEQQLNPTQLNSNHRIGIGPQAHFIIPSHGTKKTIYIATKDCHLVLLSNLTKDTANNNALLQLDLISRILCLRDCATNSSNCGQVCETAMIVDFRIEKQTSWISSTKETVNLIILATAVKTPHAVKLYEKISSGVEVVGEYRMRRIRD